MIGYSILGLVIGQFLRSAVAAVILGFAWLLVVEQFILTRIVPGAAPWLPGISLSTIAGGGNADFSICYTHGLIVAVVYIVAASAAACGHVRPPGRDRVAPDDWRGCHQNAAMGLRPSAQPTAGTRTARVQQARG